MKAQIIHGIECLGLKEETGGLNEEERLQRRHLQDEFRRKVHQEEKKWKQRSRV